MGINVNIKTIRPSQRHHISQIIQILRIILAATRVFNRFPGNDESKEGKSPLGKTGKMLDDIDVTFKCAPLVSYEDWLAITGISAHNDIGSYTGAGALKQLVFRDPKAGGYGFTGLSAKPENPSATFGATPSPT